MLYIRKILKDRKERRKINKHIGDYPCIDYLHNALRFIDTQRYDAAYDEICHAIIRSGGQLRDDEQQKRWTNCLDKLPETSGIYEILVETMFLQQPQTCRDYCFYKNDDRKWDCPSHVKIIAWRKPR